MKGSPSVAHWMRDTGSVQCSEYGIRGNLLCCGRAMREFSRENEVPIVETAACSSSGQKCH